MSNGASDYFVKGLADGLQKQADVNPLYWTLGGAALGGLGSYMMSDEKNKWRNAALGAAGGGITGHLMRSYINENSKLPPTPKPVATDKSVKPVRLDNASVLPGYADDASSAAATIGRQYKPPIGADRGPSEVQHDEPIGPNLSQAERVKQKLLKLDYPDDNARRELIDQYSRYKEQGAYSDIPGVTPKDKEYRDLLDLREKYKAEAEDRKNSLPPMSRQEVYNHAQTIPTVSGRPRKPYIPGQEDYNNDPALIRRMMEMYSPTGATTDVAQGADGLNFNNAIRLPEGFKVNNGSIPTAANTIAESIPAPIADTRQQQWAAADEQEAANNQNRANNLIRVRKDEALRKSIDDQQDKLKEEAAVKAEAIDSRLKENSAPKSPAPALDEASFYSNEADKQNYEAIISALNNGASIESLRSVPSVYAGYLRHAARNGLLNQPAEVPDVSAAANWLSTNGFGPAMTYSAPVGGIARASSVPIYKPERYGNPTLVPDQFGNSQIIYK